MLKYRCVKVIRNTIFILFVGLTTYGCGFVFDEQETMRSAESYQSIGKHNAAIIELKKVLKKNSSNKQARILLAKSYIAIGQGASAEKELSFAKKMGVPMTKLVGLWGESLLLQKEYKRIFNELPVTLAEDPVIKAELMLQHGYAYLSLNNKVKAGMLFSQVKNSQQLSDDVDIALSRLAIVNNDIDKAAKHILDAININDKNVMAWLLKGQIMLASQNTADAESAFGKAVELSVLNGSKSAEFQARLYLTQISLSQKNMELAKERIKSLNKVAPNHPTSKYLSALIAFQTKNYDMAQTSLEEVLLKSPNDLRSKLLLGAVHFAKGNYEQANKNLTIFVKNVPSHIHARKMLAAVQVKLGRDDDALRSLKSGINKDIQDTELLAMIGQTAIRNNRPDEAIDFLKQASKTRPEIIEFRTELAKAYMQKGSFDSAIAELQNIKGEGAKQAKVMLVYAHLQKKDIKSARKIAKQLLNESPDLPEPYVMVGTVELVSGNRDQAEIYFNKSLLKQPDYIPALLALARMSFENSDLERSKKLYEKVLQKDTKNEKAIVGLAVISGQNGDIENAITRLEQALNSSPNAFMPGIILGRYHLKRRDPVKALDVITALAKSNQNKPNVLSMLVQAQLLAGKKQNALETANLIVKKWPKSPLGYMEQARAQSALNQVDLTEISLKKALNINPDLMQAKTSLFTLYLRAGKNKKAMTLASQLKQQYPKLAMGNVFVGDVHMMNKSYQLAQKEYQVALNKQRVGGIINKLSVAYERGGKKNKALKQLRGWLKEKPDDTKSRMQLAVLYSRLKDNKNAKLQYQQLLDNNPKNVAVLNNLALLYLKNEPQKAITYAEKAFELQPKAAAILDTYGWVLFNSRQIEKSLPLLAEAASKSSHPSIQYHYAVVLAKTGDKLKARNALRKIVGTKFDEATYAFNLLKQLEK